MKRKFIPLQSKIFEHRFWLKKRIFSEFEAWLWIIHNAHYPNSKASKSGVVYGRGQMVTSYSELCKIWGWSSKSRIHRFLNDLTDEKMISTETVCKSTLLSVINYDNYNPLMSTASGSQMTIFDQIEPSKSGGKLYKNKNKPKNSKIGNQSIKNQLVKPSDLNKNLQNDENNVGANTNSKQLSVRYKQGGGQNTINSLDKENAFINADYQSVTDENDDQKNGQIDEYGYPQFLDFGTIDRTVCGTINGTIEECEERLNSLDVNPSNDTDNQYFINPILLDVKSKNGQDNHLFQNDERTKKERFEERSIYYNKEYNIEDNKENINTYFVGAELGFQPSSASEEKNKKNKLDGRSFSAISDKVFKSQLKKIWEKWFLEKKGISYYWSAVDGKQLENLGNRICHALWNKNQNAEDVSQENFLKAFNLILGEAEKDEFFLHKSCKMATLVSSFGDLLARIVARENGKLKEKSKKDSSYYHDLNKKNMNELETYLKENGFSQ